jgi:predicted MFS family arabinose efflux permease
MIGRMTLQRHPAFVRLWAAQTVSVFGSQVSLLALPLTAVLTLQATPFQMGLLSTAMTLPVPLVVLFAGVLTDRVRRKPLLIGMDWLRAVLLLLIPLTAALHLLNLEVLLVVAFLSGACSIVFDVAYQPYLGSIVKPGQLIDGNGKLETSNALAEVAGPGLAGVLIALLGAPMTVLVDALSFVGSAVILSGIRSAEVSPDRGVLEPDESRPSLWHQIREGLLVVLRHEVLRPLAVFSAMFNFFYRFIQVSLILYATRTLGIGALLIGLLFAAEGAGGLIGSLLPGWALRRFGLGRTLVASTGLMGAGCLLLPLAAGPVWLVDVLLAVGLFVLGLSSVVYRVQQISLRQVVTPARLLGRMNASTRFLTWGVMPFGALAGGLLGEWASPRVAVLVGALGCAASCLWVFFSPVRALTVLPAADRADHAP